MKGDCCCCWKTMVGKDPIPVFVVVSVVASSSRWQQQQENGSDHEAPNQVFWKIKGTTMCAKGTTTCRGIQRSWTTHHLPRRRWRRRRWWRSRQGSTQKLKTNNNKESLVPEQWTWWGHDCCINPDGTSGRYTLNILSPLQIAVARFFAQLICSWIDLTWTFVKCFVSALHCNPIWWMGSVELVLQVCFMMVDLGSGRKIWNSFEDTCSSISGRRPCLQTNTNPNSRTNQNYAQWWVGFLLLLTQFAFFLAWMGLYIERDLLTPPPVLAGCARRNCICTPSMWQALSFNLDSLNHGTLLQCVLQCLKGMCMILKLFQKLTYLPVQL